MKFRDALVQARRMLDHYRAFEKVVEVLEAAAHAEQYLNETDERVQGLDKQIDARRAELAKLDEEIADRTGRLSDMERKQRQRVQEYDKQVREHRGKASARIKQLDEEAEQRRVKLNQQIREKRGEYDALQAKIVGAQQQLNDLKRQLGV